MLKVFGYLGSVTLHKIQVHLTKQNGSPLEVSHIYLAEVYVLSKGGNISMDVICNQEGYLELHVLYSIHTAHRQAI